MISGLSYTIRALNVTIDRDVVLEYARTHTQNGGPVLAIVLLVLFVIVMTLVWVYLALCSCCCAVKRATTPRVSPRSPGSSPVSPSRSSAPLRGRGGDRSSSPYAMGGGGGKGGATPRSPYALGRVTSWERERPQYSFRCLYVCSGIFSAILLICVLGVFASQTKLDGSVRLLADESGDFILATADALCTSSESAPRVCLQRSAGKFVETGGNETTDILADTLTIIDSLGGRVLPDINATVDELTAAKAQLNHFHVVADRINANITEIEQLRAWLLDAADTAVAQDVPQGDVSGVTAEQLAAVDDAIAAVDVGISQAQNVSASVSDFVATQMPQLEGELNPINGTTARQLLDPLEQLLVSILSARDRVMRAHADVEEGEDQYGGYLTQKTWAVTILFLLPLLLQVTFTLMNRSYAKCSGHLVVNMCCSCLCLVLFTLCALVFSTLAVVSSAACEYHLQAIDKIPPRNITIEDNVQLEINPAVIKSVLTCPAGPVATPTNNLVSLLGADQLFNVTDEAEEAISQIGEARASFDSPEAQIQLALIEVEQLGNGTTAFNATEALESLPSTRQEIADLLARLPSDPMDRQNATQRDSLLHYYLASQTNPPFSWAAYQTGIGQVDAVLATADPTTPLPAGFQADNDFSTMHNFTRATVQQHLAAWQAVQWTQGNDLNDLLAELQATDPYTEAVNDADASNAEVRTNLTAMDQGLEFVRLGVEELDAGQAALLRLQASVNGTLHALLGEVHEVEAALDGEEANVRELAAYVGTAPEYARCGFVGEFYKEGFQGVFCGGFHHSASIAWPFMLGAAVCLFVSFLTFSCFVRKPVWFLDPGYEEGLERNALSPGRTPHGGAYIVA